MERRPCRRCIGGWRSSSRHRRKRVDDLRVPPRIFVPFVILDHLFRSLNCVPALSAYFQGPQNFVVDVPGQRLFEVLLVAPTPQNDIFRISRRPAPDGRHQFIDEQRYGPVQQGALFGLGLGAPLPGLLLAKGVAERRRFIGHCCLRRFLVQPKRTALTASSR